MGVLVIYCPARGMMGFGMTAMRDDLLRDVLGVVFIMAVAVAALIGLHLLMDGENPLSLAVRSVYSSDGVVSGATTRKPMAVLFVLYVPAFFCGIALAMWRRPTRHSNASTLACGAVIGSVLFLLNWIYPKLVGFDMWWLRDVTAYRWVVGFLFQVPVMTIIFWLFARAIEDHRVRNTKG